jgi:hypothetical protein
VALVGAGAGGGRGVAFVVHLPSSLSSSGSTRDPSYEQLLVGMGAGAVSSAGAWCGCGWHWQCAPAIHPTSSCSWAWGGCWLVICRRRCALGKVVVGGSSAGRGGYTRVGGGLPGVPPVFCVPPPPSLSLSPFAVSVIRHPGGGVPVFGVVRLHFSLKMK